MPSTFASPLSAHWGVAYATPAAETGFLEGFPQHADGHAADAQTSRGSDVSWTSLMSARGQYTSVAGPVGSGGRCPTVFRRRSLNSFAEIFGRPTNSVQRYPPISLVALRPSLALRRSLLDLVPRTKSRLRRRRSPPPSRVLCTRSTSPSALHWWRQGAAGCLPMRSRGSWIADVVSETEGDGWVGLATGFPLARE